MPHFTEHLVNRWTPDSLRLIATPSRVARETFFYVQEVGQFRTQPGYYTERANLDSFLVLYTLSGHGALRYGGQTFLLEPGQVCWLDCMEPHVYQDVDGQPWEMIWVHFQGATSRAYYEQFHQTGHPVVTEPDAQEVPLLLLRLLALHRTPDRLTELQSSSVLVALLTRLLLLADAVQQPDAGIPAWVRHVRDVLDHRFDEEVPLEELAMEVAVSRHHLMREFKRYLGQSPHAWQIGRRINRAKELLQYTDLPVARVAETVGMPHVSHFIGQFREREGMTPLAFRKAWQGE